jgi:hypothetical protein
MIDTFELRVLPCPRSAFVLQFNVLVVLHLPPKPRMNLSNDREFNYSVAIVYTTDGLSLREEIDRFHQHRH